MVRIILIFFFLSLTRAACAQVMDFSFEMPLVDAANHNDKHEVIRLLKTGVSVDSKGLFGTTALMRAAYNGNSELCQILVEHKANVNAIDIGGATALHIAARQGHAAVVDFLIKHGANPEVKDGEGFNPVSRAIKLKKTHIADKMKGGASQVDTAAPLPMHEKQHGSAVEEKVERQQILPVAEPLIVEHEEPQEEVQEEVQEEPLIEEADLEVASVDLEPVDLLEPSLGEVAIDDPAVIGDVKDNRLLSKLASVDGVLGDLGAQDRSVLDVHEDLSTKSTTQSATEVEFRKKSNEPVVDIEHEVDEETRDMPPMKKNDRHEGVLGWLSDTGKIRKEANHEAPEGISVAEAFKLPDDIDPRKEQFLIKHNRLERPKWIAAGDGSPGTFWVEISGLESKDEAEKFWKELARDKYFQGSSSRLMLESGASSSSQVKLQIGKLSSHNEALAACNVAKKHNAEITCDPMKN